MTLDLTGVEVFVAVAQQQHFGAAARELGVSISTVTKRLQRLEASLGVPLVLRGPNGFLGLTSAGQRFVAVAPGLLREAQAASALAAGEPHSTLRVAVPAGMGVVAPCCPLPSARWNSRWGTATPVAVLAVPTSFDQLTDGLLTGGVDVVLSFGASPTAGLASVRLSPLHRVGLVAATHPLAPRETMAAADFARQPMLYTPGLPDHYMHPFLLADVRPLEEASLVPVRASTTAHVAQRLLAGREVTVVPLALTANLTEEFSRILLRGLPPAWYFANHRDDDHRPELITAIELMGDFTESISRAATR